ncbi:hypothetical protein CLV51_102188 [Chitinophaga niastensis]|uniref:Uncharacterized protein n=1 Tax=Chitinophaga niastensis TaxID=536980 RepID=A0A2P8HM98_CHINA|nr:hypothetical protein CLV51_102188 [Chitinophaga niastensis]
MGKQYGIKDSYSDKFITIQLAGAFVYLVLKIMPYVCEKAPGT